MEYKNELYVDGKDLDIYQEMLDEGIGTGGELELIEVWQVPFENGAGVEVQVFDLIDNGPFTQALLFVKDVQGAVAKTPQWYTFLEGDFVIQYGSDTYTVTVKRKVEHGEAGEVAA